MSAPILHHSPRTEFPRNPSWPLLEYPNITQLLTSPPILECGPIVVAPYIFAPILIVAFSHKAKGPRIIDPSMISEFFPIYIGPSFAFKEHSGKTAPSSIKI